LARPDLHNEVVLLLIKILCLVFLAVDRNYVIAHLTTLMEFLLK